MPVVTESDVRRALAERRPAPVYLLVGDDAAAKDPLLEAFVSLVEPDLRAFNTDRFYADEDSPVEVLAAARTLPVMAPLRVVVVLRAEAWFKARGRAADDDADDEDARPAVIEEYLEAPVAETCLVLVASDVNRTLRHTKLLLRQADVVEYWGLKPEKDSRRPGALREALARGGRLVVSALKEAGLSADAEAVDALVDYAGTDVAALRNAVEHLTAYVAGRSRVTLEDVRAVARGSALIDDWALTNAIQHGDARSALHQLDLQLGAGRSPFQVLGMLGWWVRERLPEVRERHVPAAVEAMLRADLDLKSSADQQIVLERLVVELCEGGRRA